MERQKHPEILAIAMGLIAVAQVHQLIADPHHFIQPIVFLCLSLPIVVLGTLEWNRRRSAAPARTEG